MSKLKSEWEHLVPAKVKALSPQHQLFVYAYLAANFNGTEAAIRAGYATSNAYNTASLILSRPDVSAALQALIEQRAARWAERTEAVIEELYRLGLSNMLDYVTIDARGKPDIDLSGLTRARASAIQEITSEIIETLDGDPEKGIPDRRVVKTKLKLHAKEPSLKLLGQHLGLFNQDGSNPNGQPPGSKAMQIGTVNVQVVYEDRKQAADSITNGQPPVTGRTLTPGS